VRILITGASGFIGSHLGHWLSREHDIVGIVNRAHREPSFRFARVDLRDERAVAAWMESFVPHVIVHSAALSRVVECEDQPDAAFSLNVRVTTQLVRWAERLRSKFIFLSSDQVFSGCKGGLRESDTPDPVSVYGRTKLEGERVVLSSAARCVVVRSNSVVGLSIGWGESFSQMVLNRMRQGLPVTLFQDQYRSPIHIRAMVRVLERACVQNINGLLHVGGLKRMSRLDVGYAVARAYGMSADLIEPASYLSHPRASLMTADTSYDIARLRQVMPGLELKPLDEEFGCDAEAEGCHEMA